MKPVPVNRLQAIAERASTLCRQALARGNPAPDVTNLMGRLYALIDDKISKSELERAGKAACKRGCSDCCYRVVLASIAEVAAAAAFIEATFSVEQKVRLRERLYEYERQVAPNFGYDLGNLRPPCPLLIDGNCSIYSGRPVGCRGINSDDARACRQFRDRPGLAVRIPVFREQLQISQAAMSGLDHGLGQSGLLAGPHDFGRALKKALEDSSTILEWLQGGRPFEAAFSQTVPSEERPQREAPSQYQYASREETTGIFDNRGLRLAEYLWERGETKAAMSAIQGRHPGYAFARMRLPLAYESEADELEWRNHLEQSLFEFAQSAFDPREAYDGLMVLRTHDISYQQVNNRKLLSKIGDLVCNRIAAQALPELCEPIERKKPEGKIRVGFIGYDLRVSSLAPWTLGWIKNLSKDFETYAIHLGETQDEVSREVARHADRYFHLPRRRPVPEDARFIKGLSLDAIVYLDVGAKARTNQLACLRLAPVQCGCWGGPETSGFPTVDYYFSSDSMECPSAQDHYSEKLIKFPGAGICFQRETGGASLLEKRDFGMDGGHLAVSLQPPAKFDPQWDDLYREINSATGQPILIVDRNNQDRKILRERFLRSGVRAKFVRQLGLSDYRGLLKIADVVLDTPGWNGGITTIHALDVGVPVITLPTQLRRGRQSACFLDIAGAPGLIARDRADYVSLASTPDRLKDSIRNLNPQAIYDDQTSVRALEEFLRSVIEL
jgi:Fe-S-cluster containining protein